MSEESLYTIYVIFLKESEKERATDVFGCKNPIVSCPASLSPVSWQLEP